MTMFFGTAQPEGAKEGDVWLAWDPPIGLLPGAFVDADPATPMDTTVQAQAFLDIMRVLSPLLPAFGWDNPATIAELALTQWAGRVLNEVRRLQAKEDAHE